MIRPLPFYLLRHGESEANVLNIAAGGGVDSPLTSLGKDQADKLGAVLDQLPMRPTRIFHSPQSRARETAQRVNRTLNLSMTEIPKLHEHSLGGWEGQSWTIIKPLVYGNQTAPGGESRSDFATRIRKVLDEILTDDLDGPPLIVAHGGTFHAIGKMYEWEFGHMQNCHLHLFNPDVSHAAFPWELWQYDVRGDVLAKTRSEYCPQFRKAS